MLGCVENLIMIPYPWFLNCAVTKEGFEEQKLPAGLRGRGVVGNIQPSQVPIPCMSNHSHIICIAVMMQMRCNFANEKIMSSSQ